MSFRRYIYARTQQFLPPLWAAIIIINLFHQVFTVSVSSARWQIFVIAGVFDIMQFESMLQKYFNCSYRGSTPVPTRIIEPSIYALDIYLLKFKVNIKDTKKTSNDVVLVSLLLTLYIVLVNAIEFEQVNVD